MAERYVDSAAAGAGTGLNWTDAYTSLGALMAAESTFITTSDNLVWFSASMTALAHGSAWNIIGPTSGRPVQFITAVPGTNPPEFAISSGVQISTVGGAHLITLTASFDLRGLVIASGSDIAHTQTFNHVLQASDCVFKPAHNCRMYAGTNLSNTGRVSFTRCELALQDTGASAVQVMDALTALNFFDFKISGAGNRSKLFRSNGGGLVKIIGGDFSSAPSGVLLMDAPSRCRFEMSNVILPSAPTIWSGSMQPDGHINLVNCGDAHSNPAHYHATQVGEMTAQVGASAVHRDGGMTVNGTPCSLLIETNSTCGESFVFETPWFTGVVAAGTRTFTAYIASNGANALTNADIWLEIQTLQTSGESQWVTNDDHRVITDAAVDQDSDGSTWNNGTFAHIQKLVVSGVTIAEDGPFRARIVVGQQSSEVYADIEVVVS